MLDRAEVEHIAELAKLGLEPHEIETLGAQLEHILDYIAQLSTVDVTGVVAHAGVGPGAVRLRADEPLPSLPREAILALAPHAESGHVRVPPLLD
jgi:aspartyl-tRNA(Asn)/glutamyl-tRNA(Gln) amidotransferase subunit C